ncbi:hypothetical protein [Biostraticola tofi]|uniref:Uncharacterized protein n=1 Tax=Biostraticola tofi TaxID=466109 RepID=A0A4R3YLP7_9GAMM|nr:hypothetical protein [Biostraticola tofi]TCV93517.1 hypothetical protein EDC52_10973 [Biostraticola tofi]
MLGCLKLLACLPGSKVSPGERKPFVGKTQISAEGYSVTHSSRPDIRPVKQVEARAAMSAQQLTAVRALFDDLGVTENLSEDATINPENCGMPYFPPCRTASDIHRNSTMAIEFVFP